MTIRSLLAEHRPDDEGVETPGVETPSERPDWLEPEFKTPEDQARAYASARTEMKRVQSEADLERKRMTEQFTEALAGLEVPPAQQQQWNPSTDPTVNAYAEALGIDPQSAANALAIQGLVTQQSTAEVIRQELANFAPQLQQSSGITRDVAMRLAEQEVAPRYGDRWAEIAPKVEAQLRANAGRLPEQGSVETFAAIIDSEAKLVEYDRLQAEERRAQEERRDKMAAQTLSGETARVPIDTDEKKAEWAQVKAADTGEVPW